MIHLRIVALLSALLALTAQVGVAAVLPTTVVVVIQGVSFGAESVPLKRGQWVKWINKDPFPHTVTAVGVFDSHSIPSGSSWRYRPMKVGEIEYTCTFHPNMKAKIKVEE